MNKRVNQYCSPNPKKKEAKPQQEVWGTPNVNIKNLSPNDKNANNNNKLDSDN